MELELEPEGLEEKRDLFLFGCLFFGWEVELRPNIWSIIVLEYLIVIISDNL